MESHLVGGIFHLGYGLPFPTGDHAKVGKMGGSSKLFEERQKRIKEKCLGDGIEVGCERYPSRCMVGCHDSSILITSFKFEL